MLQSTCDFILIVALWGSELLIFFFLSSRAFLGLGTCMIDSINPFEPFFLPLKDKRVKERHHSTALPLLKLAVFVWCIFVVAWGPNPGPHTWETVLPAR